MMGAAAVTVVVVCAAMYTIFEVIERRKRKSISLLRMIYCVICGIRKPDSCKS